jgi:two-component system LytT family response regulator
MKDGTGFSVLRQFAFPSFKTIFITAYEQYSLEAFRFSALDYLLKPVDPDLLLKAINKAADYIDREKLSLKIDTFLHNTERVSRESKKVALKTADNIYIVNLRDIVYCEADEGYTNIYLADKTRILVSRTLGEYDEMFSGYNFLRIHQSYLLNVEYIKRYEKGEGGKVILSNEAILPVSARKKEQLMEFLSNL